MGSRIEGGYRRKLRALLARVRPRRLEFGVELCLRRARELAQAEGISEASALARVYEFTRWRVQRRMEVTGACTLEAPPPAEPRFLCDGSLGGLARWLRAAGYPAEWRRDRPGQGLVREAAGEVVVVTTDSRLLERGAGGPALVWVPSGMEPPAQAGVVLRDLLLTPRAPRCMGCGGVLEAVAKEVVADRIPPRTARWKDEYSLCRSCGQLFWEGTHWERIRARLERERAARVDPSKP